MGLLTFNGRICDGGAGAKQKAGGIKWSCVAMGLRTVVGGMSAAFMCACD